MAGQYSVPANFIRQRRDFMNKKLIAVAVAGLLAAPLVAQAQTANVVLYGRLNLDLEYVNATAPNNPLGLASPPYAGTADTPNVTRLSSNSSRFGLRGTEALGGGLNAIWQIESSVSGDAGGGTIAGRDTFIGLQGSWGTVRFGNFLAPYDDLHPVFGDSGTYLTSIAAQAALWANNGGYSKGTGSFDDRLGNSLRYDSPNIAGFTGSIQVALFDDAGAGGSTRSTVWSTAGQYKNGPFTGIIGFEYNNDVRCYNGVGTGGGNGTNSACGVAPTAGNPRFEADDWALGIAAAWDFGIVRVAGLYERIDYDTPQGGLKRDLYGVYFSGPVGPGKWYLGYSYADEGKGPTDAQGRPTQRVNGIAGGDDTGAYHLSISYNQPISKRTSWYVAYSRLDNDDRATYNFNINPYRNTTTYTTGCSTNSNPCGLELDGFLVGMIHLF
jgi:predicted porin